MSPKMKRLQIYIEPELDEDLARLAARRQVSKAHLLREGAKRIIREETPIEEDSLMAIVGIADVGPDDVSQHHDRYLIEHKLARSR